MKQCPFCNSEKQLVVDGPDGCNITCDNCLATIRATTRELATDKWNTRDGKLHKKRPMMCHHCNEIFTPGYTARNDTKYCSKRCRAADFQKRKKKNWEEYLQPKVIIS